MNKNIIDIWNENNKRLPIKVSRKNWNTNAYIEVVSIKELEHVQPNRKVKKKKYEVLAKAHNRAENINNNLTLKEKGLYIVNRYDYENWYLIGS